MDEKTIKQIAKLSRLNVDNDVASVSKKVSGMIEWADQLKKVNTDGIAPLFNVLDTTPTHLRKDEVTVKNIRDDILKNSTGSVDIFFGVPKIVE